MPQENNQKSIIIATLSFIVGFALAWLISANKMNSQENPEKEVGEEIPEEVLEEQNITMRGANAVFVKDQVEGIKVLIDEVVFDRGGWVVIRESDNGTPGKILGAQLFDAGTFKNGVVDLLRGTSAGQTYYVVLHADNEDRAFDPKKDLPISDTEGNMVMETFNATQGNQ